MSAFSVGEYVSGVTGERCPYGERFHAVKLRAIGTSAGKGPYRTERVPGSWLAPWTPEVREDVIRATEAREEGLKRLREAHEIFKSIRRFS
ncbi:hypothetical protein H9Q09_00830 [Aurantimonas sp. DM33-3]|uniref:hypothetical protein n=1 Tax=Aurantimonas sp. DM33-3 TaxID=2766955 RepID=UPI0016522397|nr:hypothetical protein [Aurantimonas sp. DM33-3]MBC6714728.1 hypothetical protein [Aurantimonas sp. DM33-3]